MSSVVCRARFGLSLAHPQAHEWKLHRVTSLGLLQMFVAPKLCCERRGACMMNALLPLEPSFLKAPPYIDCISVSCDLFGPGALANDVCDLSAFSRSFSPSSAVCRQIPAAGSRRRLRCPQQTNRAALCRLRGTLVTFRYASSLAFVPSTVPDQHTPVPQMTGVETASPRNHTRAMP